MDRSKIAKARSGSNIVTEPRRHKETWTFSFTSEPPSASGPVTGSSQQEASACSRGKPQPDGIILPILLYPLSVIAALHGRRVALRQVISSEGPSECSRHLMLGPSHQ
jgi:hypothetical protein